MLLDKVLSMRSLIFYLLIAVITAVAVRIVLKRRRQKGSQASLRYAVPDATVEPLESSPYSDNFVVLKLLAFSGSPYTGYELQQALLNAGLCEANDKLFHYLDNDRRLFSLASATPSGTFPLENMGSFKGDALLLFMQLKPKRRLMERFDLMLDVARQLIEELGGEIYDEQQRLIDVETLERLRARISRLEGKDGYSQDLLDRLN